jgi:hypothetical protein
MDRHAPYHARGPRGFLAQRARTAATQVKKACQAQVAAHSSQACHKAPPPSDEQRSFSATTRRPRAAKSWEYGKPLKQRLLPAHLRRPTHEDSAQLTKWRCRHRSGLYPSESEDGSRCQKPVLCSHRWMTGTRSVRWMRWERPVSPRLQRRVTIDPLSILCPSRGGSTSPEKHLDPVCAHRGKWKSYPSRS